MFQLFCLTLQFALSFMCCDKKGQNCRFRGRMELLGCSSSFFPWQECCKEKLGENFSALSTSWCHHGIRIHVIVGGAGPEFPAADTIQLFLLHILLLFLLLLCSYSISIFIPTFAVCCKNQKELFPLFVI